MAVKNNNKAKTIPLSAQEQVAVGPMQRYGAIALVLLITAVVYMDVPKAGITYIDDDMYLLKNPYLKDFSWQGLVRIFSDFYEFNYHPLTTVTYWLQYRWFGLDAGAYHTFSLLVHLVNVYLVWVVGRQLGLGKWGGAMAAALFAWHPMHVESVAWISERKGLLSTCFMLLSMHAWLSYSARNVRLHYWAALFYFILALLSKSAAVPLPLVLLLVNWWQGYKINMKTYVRLWPFVALSLLFGVLAIMSQKSGGAVNDLVSQYGIIDRIFMFCWGALYYVLQLPMPFKLSALHYYPNPGELPWYWYISLPVLVVLIWAIWRQRNYRREVVFSFLFFAISISVMLQVIVVGAAYAAERYTYFTYLGFFMVLAKLCDGEYAYARTVARNALLGLLGMYAITSWGRVGDWRDTDSILADIISKNEGNKKNYMVLHRWATSKLDEGKYAEALQLYDSAIAVNKQYGNAYYKKGEVLEAMGRIREALATYQLATTYMSPKWRPMISAGWAAWQLQDTTLALKYTNEALGLQPKDGQALNNRGWIRLQMGDTTSAMADFGAAIATSPTFAKPYANKALVYVAQGQTKEALQVYTAAIAAIPNDGSLYYNRSIVYYQLGNKAAAIADMREAEVRGYEAAQAALREMGVMN